MQEGKSWEKRAVPAPHDASTLNQWRPRVWLPAPRDASAKDGPGSDLGLQPTWSIKSTVQARSIPWLFHVLTEGHKRKSHRKTGLRHQSQPSGVTNSSWRPLGNHRSWVTGALLKSQEHFSAEFVLLHVGEGAGGRMQNLRGESSGLGNFQNKTQSVSALWKLTSGAEPHTNRWVPRRETRLNMPPGL